MESVSRLVWNTQWFSPRSLITPLNTGFTSPLPVSGTPVIFCNRLLGEGFQVYAISMDDFFRARLDQMIEHDQPLAALGEEADALEAVAA